MQRTVIFLYVLVLLLFLTGCNRGPVKPDGLPKVYPLTLQLEQDGKPLAGAEVFLRSEAIGTWSCGGISDEKGLVLVRTHGQFPGAPLGRHKVLVTKSKSSATSLDVSEAKSLVEIRELEAKAATERKPTATTYLVERKYGNADTTPLVIDIVDGKNHFQLDVGSAVEITEQSRSLL